MAWVKKSSSSRKQSEWGIEGPVGFHANNPLRKAFDATGRVHKLKSSKPFLDQRIYDRPPKGAATKEVRPKVQKPPAVSRALPRSTSRTMIYRYSTRSSSRRRY